MASEPKGSTANPAGIFYGWIIIAVSIFTICFSHSGTVNFGFSSFILPLSQEFGLGRGAISFALTASILAYTIATPVTGGLIDTYGARRILAAGTAVYGMLVCSMYFLTASVWHLYGMYFLLGLVGTTVSVIPHARLSISWFDKRKGLALALSSTGVGIAGIIIPPYIRGVIEWAGWREAYLFLGGINVLISLPLIYWVVCDRPEQKGTYPDGIPPKASAGEARAALAGYSFGECLRSPRLWLFGVIFAIFAATHVGPVSQWVPLLMDSGFTPATAAYAASLLGASLVVGRLGCGYLVDRLFAPHVAIAFQIIRIAGFTALVLDPGVWSGILATITLGLVMGAEFNLMPFFCVQYFGRLAFGKVYAVILVWFAIGAAPATFLMGLSHDIFSTYAVGLMTVVLLNVLGIGLLLTVGPYPKLPVQAAEGASAA